MDGLRDLPTRKHTALNKAIILFLLIIGVGLIIVSAFYSSSFLVILGSAIIFWSCIFFYITPTKQVPIIFLDALAKTNASNIERILSEFEITEKGIYLPPRNLNNFDSSLIFIPKNSKISLPIPEKNSEKIFSPEKDGVFITPPGLGFSQILEKELGKSFARIDSKNLQVILSKILIETFEMAEKIEIRTKENLITIELTGSIFDSLCKEAENQPHTHKQVGCLITSTLACILAKVVGKGIIIQNETHFRDGRMIIIVYQIKDEL